MKPFDRSRGSGYSLDPRDGARGAFSARGAAVLDAEVGEHSRTESTIPVMPTRSRAAAILAALSILACSLSAGCGSSNESAIGASEASRSIAWNAEYDSGMPLARETDRPAVVYFHAP